jgi:hypothetical protein
MIECNNACKLTEVKKKLMKLQKRQYKLRTLLMYWTNKKCMARPTEGESTVQYKTILDNIIQKKLYEHGPFEAWFHTYSLLMTKENVQSIHLEFPCRHCRRQTSGALYSSTTSNRAVHHDLL